MTARTRLYYIDNLRVALTILVIAHHVGQAYGPTGGSWPVQEAARAAVLGPFFTVNRSFFMSLFFMVSGYFMVAAYNRSGPRAFIRGRLVRLGVPVLVFAVAMIPARIFLFGERITSWVDLINAGHLWYLEHLLLFSLGYALWRKLRRPAGEAVQSQEPLPRLLLILTFSLVVAVLSGLVRLWSPIDRWFNLLGFFRVAFADVPRDLGFFIVGAMAYPRGWFGRYPTRAGIGWLAIVYPLWENLLCCALCIGLLVLFRQALNSQGTLGRVLAENQYSAYFWHPLLIVPLQMAFLGAPLSPFAKFVLVTIVGVPLVFLWSHLLRRPRVVRAIL